jgi:hypothetical protein
MQEEYEKCFMFIEAVNRVTSGSFWWSSCNGSRAKACQDLLNPTREAKARSRRVRRVIYEDECHLQRCSDLEYGRLFSRSYEPASSALLF